MKKRPRRSSANARRASAAGEVAPARQLQYKVVELSTVDEAALEAAVNEWVGKGWRLENVQFAMRESSKRPSMAFVFFTRQGEAERPDLERARKRLWQLSEEPPADGPLGRHVPDGDPRLRLARLAEVDAPELEE